MLQSQIEAIQTVHQAQINTLEQHIQHLDSLSSDVMYQRYRLIKEQLESPREGA